MGLIDRITSHEVIDAAYEWLCTRRHVYLYNNDIWHLRRWWDEKKPDLVAQLLAGNYRFRELRCVRTQGDVREIWSAPDALVLKALAIVLSDELNLHLSPRCFHLPGTG